ncbi:MAG: Slp family lipoprotein, partial [Thermodesulfobacteriota bacterium]
ILQHPAKPGGRPGDTDVSDGRFLAETPQFLDAAIFEPGRRITVAGRVVGSRSGLVGEVQYQYPVIMVEEVHLWREGWPVHWGFFFSTEF